jgi:hypothetical protein
MTNVTSVDPTFRSEDQYFAARPVLDLITYCNSKSTDYYDFVLKYRFLDKWKRTYLAYYGMSQSGTDSSKLNQAGVNGEEYILKVNDFRSLLLGLLTMTTNQRPALQPKARNTDSKSLNETVLARTVLDYYMSEKHIEDRLKDSVEFALFGAEGFVVLDWDAKAGEEYGTDPDSGAIIYDGDLTCRAFHPIDVVRECWGENAKRTWYIVREFQNKWDLASKYPDQAEGILSVSDSSDFMKRYSNINYTSQTDVDHIPVFTFYHEKSPSLPNGRMTKYTGADICLTDGPLPFKNMPVYRTRPAEWHGTPFGYTVAYDLLGIQSNLDALNSIVATNQMNYGIQNILLPRGGEYNVYALAQGLNGIEYDPKVGEPKALNLLETPEEILKNIERLEKKQETLSGINSVARGDVDRDLSGAALALIASQAVQFNNGLQQSYNSLLEEVGTGIIEILQEYALTPRMASIAGKSNRARVQEFKGADLAGINRVGIEQVNPMSKTAAGRMTMADNMLKGGLIKTPQHYFEVIMTGTLDSLYEHETSQILLIRSENEDLADGKKPMAILTDNHRLHIDEHSTVLDSPEARSNPMLVNNTVDHMQEHFEILGSPDPKIQKILMLLGQQPLGAPPQQQQPQSGPPPHGPSGPAGPQMVNPTTPLAQEAGAVKGPNMPNLPAQAPPGAVNAYAQMKSNVGQ